MKKYWHIYMLVLVWAIYDALSFKYGKSYVFISAWHIGMLVFIFKSVLEKLPTKYKAINISLISFLIVIFIKILLNLIAAFGADYQKYNSFVNNAYVDFGVLIFIFIAHFSLGLKKWSK